MNELKLTQITKQFGHQVILDDINLTFKPNTIYGLLGRNGVGKSTLLNIITNRIFASSGTISWQDQALTGRDHPVQAFYLMSETNLFSKEERLNKIIKNTALLQGQFDETLSAEMMTAFGLNPKKKLSQLSTGYRTIFKAMLALCVPAEVVFLDEPILGLDANHREMLYQFILKAYEERPRTIVLATHLIEEIANLIEHVVILNETQVIIDEPLETVLAKSYRISGPEEVVQAYCQELNQLATEQLGTLYIAYIYDQLPTEREIPDRLTIEHVDLQQTFIKLTNERGNRDV
ncbi:ATP-binding cassette domain-containing protein [Latilactobacillus fuchuensis]|uniref:ABC transporter family protein n=1 Tax=Latilactobacillus fuchuensis DSM 14340 = JCM 11249 TaxID=1423747 RepID=A0A0R1S5F9_9LACO|nr:ABC transporter ATP-binding protein [Latilactobacillus fuchuensis]KRL62090.1 ABC transporter family protein [Latilactobacillus fuchuensis DSM 14340 = JCM 11249]MCP8856949.1 ABC transporter ATP-binding protein [Latilactobacillus fuchuensis]